MNPHAGALVATLLLAGCGAVPTATTPIAPDGVVPWADLPPAHHKIAVHRVPGSPDPAAAEKAPVCRSDQLRLTSGRAGAAGGTVYDPFVLHLVGTTPCAVDGTPKVIVLGTTTPIPTAGDGGVWPLAYHHPVLLTPDATATVDLEWSDAVCDARDWTASTIAPSGLRMALSGGAIADTPLGGGHTLSCHLDADHGGPTRIETVAVGHVYPTKHRDASTTSTWADVGVTSSDLRLRGTPGSTLTFDVTLMARGHDMSLAPCPDYRIAFYGYGHRAVQTHQLDCTAVPTIRDGAAYLPAGVPVTFAMQARAPAYSSPKTLWQIVDRAEDGPSLAGAFTPTGRR